MLKTCIVPPEIFGTKIGPLHRDHKTMKEVSRVNTSPGLLAIAICFLSELYNPNMSGPLSGQADKMIG